MQDFYRGRVAIVTGSSNGIGRETARVLASRGARVTITGRNRDAIHETRRLCMEGGAREEDLLEVEGDLSEMVTIEKIVNETVAKFGGIDLLVNNAATSFPSKLVGIEQPIELFDKTIAVNLRPVILLTQLSLPYLEKTAGSIVNVSSIAALPLVIKSAPYYAVVKAALDSLTVQMAGTLIYRGIRVNAVSPGLTRTHFHESAGVPKAVSQRIYSASSDVIPIGRAGEAREVAELIAFLGDSSKSEYIVGQSYIIDGGATLLNNLNTLQMNKPKL